MPNEPQDRTSRGVIARERMRAQLDEMSKRNDDEVDGIVSAHVVQGLVAGIAVAVVGVGNIGLVWGIAMAPAAALAGYMVARWVGARRKD